MSDRSDDIAIIGMACVFPGAANMQQYWENILAKVDAISDPPADWEAELFWDPDSTENDRTYCKRGGYLGKLASFDPYSLGIMPNAVDGTEPDHFMALRAAHDALADSGLKDISRVKDRTAVIIGRGTYVNRGNAAALQQGVVIQSVIRILQQLHPEYSTEELALIKKELRKSAPQFQSDTASGLVPNIISGRIANRLDLMGPNYLVDAACASSLVAVEHGIRELQSGRCDLALAGGVHANTSPVLVMIFSQLKALSRKGQMRPFDAAADGTLLGEGVGMVVLKRLADAERDRDKIYAVLKGIGIASDGRALGVLAPRIEGEITAIERAYEMSGIDPATIGLLEAHGTSTPVGDATECEALRRVFGERHSESPRCALGSVKSMISHTMPASGMAGLIKSALALHHKVLPPTLHVENPNPKLGLEKSNFYLNSETRPWIHGFKTHPRRAGINAFGFGGINAHAILEEYTGPNRPAWLQHQWDSELFVMSAASREELAGEARRVLAAVELKGAELNLKDLAWTLTRTGEPAVERLTVVAASREDLIAKLNRAIAKLSDERTKQIKDIEGIYWFRDKLASQGKLAFIFPGEGSQYQNMLADLCMHFPEVREVFDQMDRAYEGHPRGYLPSDVMFPPPLAGGKDRLWNMDSGAESVFCANQALEALLRKFEIQPDAMVGHSTGEHSALLAADVVQVRSEEDLLNHIKGVYEVFERLSTTSGIPEAVLLAIAGADHKLLEDLVAASNGALYIALDNCVHQVVICGKEDAIDRLLQALAGKAAIAQKLPFARAYHTPWFEVFSRPLKAHFDRLAIGKARVDLYSCVTTERYPEDPDTIRQLAAVQWASTVRFRETTETMYRDGVRIFVEVGPKSNLSGFVDDVLRGKPHVSIPSNVQHRSGILQLHHMLGQLVAHGVKLTLAPLYERRDPKPYDEILKPRRSMVLATGIQPIRLPKDFAFPQRPKPAAFNGAAKHEPLPVPVAVKPEPVSEPAIAAAGSPRDAVMEGHLRTMQQFLVAQEQFMSTLLGGRSRQSPAASPVGVRPFLNDVVEVVEGSHAIARHRFDLAAETVFWDHTLGRDVSVEDPSLLGLPVVPLTVTMEILCEAAALLEPSRVCLGMRDIRAARWVTIEQPGYTVELTARQKSPGEIHVALREAGSASALRPVFAEAIVLFGDQRAASGGPMPFHLENERPSAWDPSMLYRTGMFHGALMQGVKSVERAGRNGTSATLEALPPEVLFANNANPAFVFDPILLDAAGQVVAYWFWEAIEKGTDLFPYRVRSFDIFEAAPPAGTQLECRVIRKVETAMMTESDIEVLDRSGKVYYRLLGWETRRFPQPPRFLQLRISPRNAYVSAPWPDPLAGFKGQVSCRRIDDLSSDFLESSHSIWLKALAYLVLNPTERAEWEAMKAVPKRKHEWLLGRCAAKDAVRQLVLEQHGLVLCAADVEITYDGHGKPEVRGAWMARLGVKPAISISHSHGIAVAMASLEPKTHVGIDIETLDRPASHYESLAFRDEERKMLSQVPPARHDEWALRLWTAKEAVSKALGQGFHQGLHSLHITGFDEQSGKVKIELGEALAKMFPKQRGKSIQTVTARNGNLAVATTLLTD